MASYRDILRLRALENQIRLEDIQDPDLPTVSQLQSPDDYVGWEHFYEFNESVVETSKGRAGVAFKEAIGSYGIGGYVLSGGRRYASTYAKPLNRAQFLELTNFVRDSIIDRDNEGVALRDDVPQLGSVNVDILPFSRVPSSAEFQACAQFAIRAGTLIELYADTFATLDDTRRGQSVYIKSALATQIQTQLS